MRKAPYHFYVGNEISNDLLDNLIRDFRYLENRKDIIGYYDISALLQNRKVEYLFTIDRIIYKEDIGRYAKQIKYGDIKTVELDTNKNIIFNLIDDEVVY